MSGSVNKVVLIGYLGHKPDMRTTQYGGKVASFSLATSESWTDKNSGERREKTEWHRIVIYNEELVEFAEQYLDRGSKIYLVGQTQTHKWQNGSGTYQYTTTEIVLQKDCGSIRLLDSQGNNNVNSKASASSNTSASKSYAQQRARAGIRQMMTCHSNEHNSLLNNCYFNRI